MASCAKSSEELKLSPVRLASCSSKYISIYQGFKNHNMYLKNFFSCKIFFKLLRQLLRPFLIFILVSACFFCSFFFVLYSSGQASTILVIIFWDLLMFYQIFLSPQVKRIVIITNKYSIYQLPNELPNDLRLRILGN